IDPRDTVYALLSLAPDPLGIQADYGKSVGQVFLDVAVAHIKSCRNLDIIAQSQWEALGHSHRRPDIPTWVPDFSNPGESDLLFAQRGIFAAGSDKLNRDLWQVKENRFLVL